MPHSLGRAFALQADGWFLRSDIIRHKPNGQPESVKDRPTRSHEYVFLFSKSEKYFLTTEPLENRQTPMDLAGINAPSGPSMRNLFLARTLRFPPRLVEICVLAGSRRDDLILDPFFGSGTLGEVCLKLHRKFIGIELNEEYARPNAVDLRIGTGYHQA